MKDILIKKEKIAREFQLWIILFATSFIINVAAIIIYKAPWIELITQLHYVVTLSVILYLGLSIFRALYLIVKRFIKFFSIKK